MHHAYRYGRLLAASFGYLRQDYRVIESRGTIMAAIPLMQFSVGRLCRSLQSLPFDIYGGPVLHPDHTDDADLHRAIARDVDELAGRRGAFEVRFSIPVSAPPAVERCLKSLGHVESKVTDCPVLTLGRPLEQIRQGYSAQLRRALRVSARQGVTVEVGAPLDVLESLYPLYRARMQQIGATVKPWRFIEGVVTQRIGLPFVAHLGGRAIGFLILLATPGIAIYWISAMEPDASRTRPMNAMLDAAIAWSHAEGIPRFSFGESHGRSGLVRFKQSFGPEMSQHVVMVRTYRPMIQRSWSLLEPAARRSYALWDRWRAPLARRLSHRS
ncbi:MAG TPA: GNAT family N-acetyltransferase [Gemmatimonadales bacterium]|nr:GNAT family N-acetyltransferase [Gemmatimonadales bacterium]